MSRETGIAKLEQEIAELQQLSAAVPDPIVETESNDKGAASQEPIQEAETNQEPKEPTPEELIAKYKEDAEQWKKRRKDAEKGLTEMGQERAELKKQVDELRTQIEALKAQPTVSTESPLDWEGFDDIGNKVEQRLGMLENRLESKLQETMRLLEQEREKAKEIEFRTKAEEHYAKVASVHSDASDFFNPEHEMNAVLLGWAQTQAPEYLETVENPISRSPQFVSRMLSELKRDLGMTKAKAKPDLGDIAVKKGATVVAPAAKQEVDVFTDEELASLPRLIASARGNQDALAAIEAKLDRTYKTRR